MTVPKYREVNLKRRYGLSLEDYNTLIKQQEGKCKVCSEYTETLQVDHCHQTNTIRGLLCLNCNTALGKLQENPLIIQRAKEYVMTATDNTQVGGEHYVSKAIQPWQYMEGLMSEEAFKGFLWGNSIKYISRWEDKGGILDLQKAKHYLDKLIEHTQGS